MNGSLAESRALGADAVLLIAGVLGEASGDMVDLGHQRTDLNPLWRFIAREEIKDVLSTVTRLAGINNRDLRTMRTDLSTTLRLAPSLRDAGLDGCIRERVDVAL